MIKQDQVTILLKEKEGFFQSLYKDIVTFSLLIFCIYISQNSTWWTFLTGGMFIIFTLGKIGLVLSKSKTTFTDEDEAIKFLTKIKESK